MDERGEGSWSRAGSAAKPSKEGGIISGVRDAHSRGQGGSGGGEGQGNRVQQAISQKTLGLSELGSNWMGAQLYFKSGPEVDRLGGKFIIAGGRRGGEANERLLRAEGDWMEPEGCDGLNGFVAGVEKAGGFGGGEGGAQVEDAVQAERGRAVLEEPGGIVLSGDFPHMKEMGAGWAGGGGAEKGQVGRSQ